MSFPIRVEYRYNILKGDIMQQMHSEQMSQQGRVFTAEEAGEILKRAVRLQEERISVQQLYAIAEETGISREAVEQAIKEHDRNQLSHKIASSSNQSKRKGWLRRSFRATLIATVAIVLVGIGYVLGEGDSNDSYISYSPIVSQLASSEDLAVTYSREWGSGRIMILDQTSGQSYTVGLNIGYSPNEVSISPSNTFIVLNLGDNRTVYLVRRDGTGLQEISPPTSILDQLHLSEVETWSFRFQRWHKEGDKESLVLEWWVEVDSNEGNTREGSSGGYIQVFLRYDPETGEYSLYQPQTGGK